MERDREQYDWGQAVYDLYSAQSERLIDLVLAAKLDPKSGDVSHIDLRGMNLEGQDFGGWNLGYARFEGAVVTRCNFVGAQVRPEELVLASGWQSAIFDEVDGARSRHRVCQRVIVRERIT